MSKRLLPGVIAAAVAGMMAVALYMQHVMGLAPCPLCMMQRIWVSIAGIVAFVAWLHAPHRSGQRAYAAATMLACAIGAGFAIRQLYLQSLPPDQVPACGPELEYMLQAFPLKDILRAMIIGTGNCAKVDWSLFGISIAGYVLMAVTGLFALAAVQWAKARD